MHFHTYLKKIIGDYADFVVYQKVGKRLPSDCVWLIPGTEQEKYQ
jgi:hypothetical protein